MLNTYEKILIDEGIRSLQGRKSAGSEQQRAGEIVDLAEFLLDRLVATGEMPQWRAGSVEPIEVVVPNARCEECAKLLDLSQ